MIALLLLILGFGLVLGGVLALRLHAFLALMIAAFFVAALTPTRNVRDHLIVSSAFRPGDLARQSFRAGDVLEVIREGPDGWESAGPVHLVQRGDSLSWNDALLAAPVADGDLFIHAGDLRAAIQASQQAPERRVAQALGKSCSGLAIIIAMAAIIGRCMMESGAADRLVRAMLHVCGERLAPWAFLFSGFALGVPVFFDTVFYLMIPLGKALSLRTGGRYLLYVLAIVCGGTMAHSLVPPTPGPTLVAEALNVDLGRMILMGGCVGLFASGVGLAFAYWLDARHELPLRSSESQTVAQLKAASEKPLRELPSLAVSVLPIALPVLLIAGLLIWKSFGDPPRWAVWLGDRNIALTLAAIVALIVLAWSLRHAPTKGLREHVQAALSSGGVVILITAAGGAFGAMLQQAGVIALVRSLPLGSSSSVLVLAFLVTMAVRTAQGSATVAMVTAAGVFAAFNSSEALGCHPVYLALAIGSGSKPIAWMNDSGFWVICKMSGMSEAEGLRYVTPTSALMGLSGLAATLVLAWLAP